MTCHVWKVIMHTYCKCLKIIQDLALNNHNRKAAAKWLNLIM